MEKIEKREQNGNRKINNWNWISFCCATVANIVRWDTMYMT